jgi:hypothetical protein
MKIYLSGKITGLEPLIYNSIFELAESQLRIEGFNNIINPTKLGIDPLENWKKAMDICITALQTCDAIYMLQNWQQSLGARKELTEAMKLHLIIAYAPDGIFKLKHHSGNTLTFQTEPQHLKLY